MKYWFFMYLLLVPYSLIAEGTGHHHHHAKIDVSDMENIPEIELLQVNEDEMSGWNLYIKTKNFEFRPDKVNSDHQHGQGHAHLYINGEKIARLYGQWFHIAKLESSRPQITVTLNTNNHGSYSVNGTEIAATIVVENNSQQKSK